MGRRNTTKTLQGTLLLMVVLQTVGTIDTQRKMPAPKQYAAITVLWGIFFLGADLGAERVMRALSMLVILPAIVIGPFGKRMLAFIETVSYYFQADNSPTAGAGTAPAQPGAFGGASPSELQTAGYSAPVAPRESIA